MMDATAEPIVRIDRDRKYLTVLCPMGHLIAAYKLDSNYGGSWLEDALGQYQAGHETHWHRSAASCRGFGH